MNKILILDPSCVGDSRSHHMYAAIGHARTFQQAGFEVIIGANTGCQMDYPAIKNEPVFNYTIYDDFKKNTNRFHKRILRKPYYYSIVINTCKAIESIFRKHPFNDTDHVFIPTLDWLLLQSLARIYKNNMPVPNLHIMIMYERANWITGGYPYKRIIDTLDEFNRERLFLYTETGIHAKRLGERTGIVPSSYPFPAYPFELQKPMLPDKKMYQVGALGGGRNDKGYALLPAIIKKFNETCKYNNNVKFLVQRARVEDRLDAQTRLLAAIDNVMLLDNQLDRQDYEQHLLNCDISLFPYSRNVYAIRGSGIINEAVANGVPIVCPENSALAESITCNNGLTADSIDDYSQAIINIIDNIDLYRNNARKAADLYVENLYNNPVIKNIKLSGTINE